MRFDIETLKTMNKAEIINALLAFQDNYKALDKSYQQSKQSEEKLTNKFNEVSKELETAKQEIVDLNTNVEKLKHLCELFKRQIFGKKSEKVFTQSLQFGDQEPLFKDGEIPTEAILPEPRKIIVKEHEKSCRRKIEELSEELFEIADESDIPTEVVDILPKEAEGLEEGKDYIRVGKKVVAKIVCKQSSLVKRVYELAVVKLQNEENRIIESKLPTTATVIEKSKADVSFLVWLTINKFLYHIPLYRQHQKFQLSGLKIRRSTLTKLVHRTADILEPVYEELRREILRRKVIQMDETPVKAGRDEEKHQMKSGYYWVIHGGNDTAFLYSPTRRGDNVAKVLQDYMGIILTDGYGVYETFALNNKLVTRAQCWAHVRRKFYEALSTEPELAEPYVILIRRLYELEREYGSEAKSKLSGRMTKSKEVVDKFFDGLKKDLISKQLLPTSLFKKAANYALKLESPLRVFLDNPEVSLDTNELERDNRYNAIGRKNYMFHWTEVGAQYGAIMYSLIVSCIHNRIDPFTYLVDVLQRVSIHPSSAINDLIPSKWKEKFGANPLRA